MKYLALALLLATFSLPAHAMVENDYEPEETLSLTTWYGSGSESAIEADKNYIKGMRPHHAGALTMSREYLDNPDSSNTTLRSLAEGIIRNQTFEISVLDDIEDTVSRSPAEINLGFVRIPFQPVGRKGLVQRARFMRSPMPAPMDMSGVTAKDVEFAKSMIIHHQAAVDMAREYHANPEAKNGYLDLMNVDIILDQTMEIALMQSVINAYDGDPDAVKIDASMIHGMEGMTHSMKGMESMSHSASAEHHSCPPGSHHCTNENHH